MPYVKINWTTTTARSTDNLDHMETQYDQAIADGGSIRADNTIEFRIHVAAAHPAGAVAGQVYLNSVSGIMYFYDGSTWKGFATATEGRVESLTAVTAAVDAGGSMQYTGGDHIYIARGGNTTNFYRYTISTDSYANMTNAPFTYPGQLAYTGGDYLYILRHNSTNFSRYSIAGNSWTAMTGIPVAPVTMAHPSLVYAGGDHLYAINTSLASAGFLRYTVSTNSWDAMTNVPGTTYAGALTYTGGDYIYATRGTEGANFYRYSIAGNSWANMTDVPVTPGIGSSMSYIGHNYIYLTRGGDTTNMYRYSVLADSWDTPNINLLAAVGDGGDMNYVGPTVAGYLYILRGGNTDDFWKITIGESGALVPQTWEDWMN